MEEPLQIGYRDVTPSAAVERAIRERAEKLDEFYDRITGCRVVVESPHRRQRQGRRFHVRVELAVPGRVIVVNRNPKPHQEYEDVYVAIRDAFDATTRQLEDYVRESRGFTKSHTAPPEGRIARLVPAGGYGFIETSDGREVYFHHNAVVDGAFERLEVGMPVRFAEELGEQGPQASSVHPKGRSQAATRRRGSR
jgi:cold shock CspA family protein/ribosome-associated translation inhibitor RaiA